VRSKNGLPTHQKPLHISPPQTACRTFIGDAIVVFSDIASGGDEPTIDHDKIVGISCVYPLPKFVCQAELSDKVVERTRSQTKDFRSFLCFSAGLNPCI